MKMAFSTAEPGLGTWKAGDVVFNTSASAGWKCTVSGTAGTLASRTATTELLSTVVTVNNLYNLEEGQHIAIAGVTGTKVIVSVDRISGTVTIDSNPDAAVTDAAVSFVAPTFVALPF
jgi:hypothetical protein